MLDVTITNPDGTAETYSTSCPLWVWVDVHEEAFRDPAELEGAHEGEF